MNRSPASISSLWIIVAILALVSILASGLAVLVPSLLDRERGALDGLLRAVFPLAVALVIALLALWASRLLVDAAQRDAARELELARARVDLALGQKARELQHDLSNHLTVVSALIQTGASDQALAYLHRIVYDRREESVAAAGASEAEPGVLLGLMGQKIAKASRLGVAFDLRVENRSEQLCVPDVVAARILGNLTDNAIDAAREAVAGEARVTVEMVLSSTRCSFRVWNNGLPIPPEMLKRIFAAGETTKGGDHQGLGLHIVHQLVREYGGSLNVQSNEASGTEFEVSFEHQRSETRTPEGRGIRRGAWSV